MRDFTVEDLREYDGCDGRAAHVAYEGVVYDVTASPMWQDGDHANWHPAGTDLTDAHGDAPHDVYVTSFPQVGRLVRATREA